MTLTKIKPHLGYITIYKWTILNAHTVQALKRFKNYGWFTALVYWDVSRDHKNAL